MSLSCGVFAFIFLRTFNKFITRYEKSNPLAPKCFSCVFL